MQIQVTRRYEITGSSSQALKNMTKGEAKAEEHEHKAKLKPKNTNNNMLKYRLENNYRNVSNNEHRQEKHMRGYNKRECANQHDNDGELYTSQIRGKRGQARRLRGDSEEWQIKICTRRCGERGRGRERDKRMRKRNLCTRLN